LTTSTPSELELYKSVREGTPAAIEKCRTRPLRVSHNSIQSYLKAGRCAFASSIPLCLATGGLLGGLGGNSWATSLVVLRKPVDRFVSSMYFWNCERATYPNVRARLLATPPRNLTAKDVQFTISQGRVDVDEPIRVLSRGLYDLRHGSSNRVSRRDMEDFVRMAEDPEVARAAARNLRDFAIVGVMEDMEGFLVKVALHAGWDPVSLAYKPARVRENAANERKAHDPTQDLAHAEGSPSGWPKGMVTKCAVRGRHLSKSAFDEVSRFVAGEQALYTEALRIHESQKSTVGKGRKAFNQGLRALQEANERLAGCLETVNKARDGHRTVRLKFEERRGTRRVMWHFQKRPKSLL